MAVGRGQRRPNRPCDGIALSLVSQSTPVDDRWHLFVDAIESGDTDRVNDVIDEIGGMDLADRVALFDCSFEDLRRRYEAAEDGYVR